jgi:hypothetical protein
MAEKWADYVITAVHFNTAGTHIEEVEARKDTGDSLAGPTTKTRATVVAELGSGYTYCTATDAGNGKWNKGAEVNVVTIDGEKFIKTKADSSKNDNLDNLPTF